ncbi:hypothetical protein CK203_117384 [Vitis vinifera]|uniref:Retrotransposon gag domain-containing protein n=1 Tax=Vitis vinifera TaxID=29760 RepID=A0A438FCN1_VITVI|nr:hypothetical protein CK203_117384 [Vitis vinifera]
MAVRKLLHHLMLDQLHEANHWQNIYALPTAKDVWDAIWETYSDAKNASQIFELKTRLWQMKQGDREVTEYYTEMLGL